MNRKLDKLLRPGMGMYFVVMGAFCALALARGYFLLAAVESVATLLVVMVHLASRRRRDRKLQQYVESMTNTMEFSAQGESPLPTVVIRLGDGEIVWANRHFSDFTGYADSMLEQSLSEFFPNFDTGWLTSGKNESPKDAGFDGRRYRVYGTVIRAEDSIGTLLGVLYFSDLTELYQVRDEYIRSRPVTWIILIDNYEELTKNLSESAISALNAKLGDAISDWTEGYHGLLRKLERNRYLFICEKRDHQRAVEDKFSLLEKIHDTVSPNGIPASISIGIGLDAESIAESYSFAALGIEMAVSRGGNQAVVKDRFNFSFYGGKGREAENGSKIRSRVVADSLVSLIDQSDRVFIMGHRNADLDVIGSASGICCLCRKRGRKANIVVDPDQNAAKKLIAEIQEDPNYKDVFLSGQDAMVLADNHSILVVVDTNRPDQVECRPLLESISKVCVVDHHRRAADYIDSVVVNINETFASSASELVTELLVECVQSDDVRPVEAKALLAGICLDTKFFNVRAGERTFEAAATLRRLGADTTDVKLLFQNDFQDTLEKYRIIKASRLYRQEIAISALTAPTNRILAAQAADELLNIAGITASFVMYPDPEKNQVIVSARSIGSANVQMILEPLGGGGNAAIAGAQINGDDVKEVLDRLVQSIDKYYEA